MEGENGIVAGKEEVYEAMKSGNVHEWDYEMSIEVEGYLPPL